MRLTFTKGSGKHDRLDVFRNGMHAESIDCPKQGIIPHDMVHYAVEGTLQKRGFIGRVLDGESATFRMEAEAESDGVERLVEVFQAESKKLVSYSFFNQRRPRFALRPRRPNFSFYVYRQFEQRRAVAKN